MRIGISLSGGGARAIAHLGLLRLFEEQGIEISAVSGSSAGAIVGAFYAHGYSPMQILDIVEASQMYKYLRPALTRGGLIDLQRTERIFRKYMPQDSFESLEIPLFIAATDISLGKTHFFSSGPVIRPLIASSSIPVLFAPVKIGDIDYFDGGILNNLPIEPLTETCDLIIGLSCNPIGSPFNGRSIKDLLERSLLLAISQNVTVKMDRCDLFIEPPELANYKVFDFGKAREIFQSGYSHGRSILSNLERFRTGN